MNTIGESVTGKRKPHPEECKQIMATMMMMLGSKVDTRKSVTTHIPRTMEWKVECRLECKRASLATLNEAGTHVAQIELISSCFE